MSKLFGNIIVGIVIVICILLLLLVMSFIINGIQSVWSMIL